MTTTHTNIVVLCLIALCVTAFALGSFRVNEQANQIAKLIDDQSPLVFAFENAGKEGLLTFTVTCTRLEDDSKYICTTKQAEPRPIVLIVPPTPTPTTQ